MSVTEPSPPVAAHELMARLRATISPDACPMRARMVDAMHLLAITAFEVMEDPADADQARAMFASAFDELTLPVLREMCRAFNEAAAAVEHRGRLC